MLDRMEGSKLNFEKKSCACAEMGGPKSACDEMGGPKYARDIFFRIFKNGSYILLLLFHADSESEIRFEIGDDFYFLCSISEHFFQNTLYKHAKFRNFCNFEHTKFLRPLYWTNFSR